ncbi:MAG: hypothetical protein ABFD60_01555 [Bryobacteraceae bacterium]
MDLTWYTNVVGIVAVTIFVIEVMKRLLGDVAFVKRFPTWLYAVLVAGILTEFAHAVLHTLQGDNMQLLTQSVMLAAGASGFKEWFSNANKPLSASSAAIAAREDKK